MTDIWQYIKTSPDTQINLILFFGGLIFTVIWSLPQLRRRRPVFIPKGEVVRVGSPRPEDQLTLFWRKKQIPNLYTYTITFLNKGRMPIRRADISYDFPLAIKTTSSIDLLGCRVVNQSRPEIILELEVTGQDVVIRMKSDEAFEFNDGFTVELVYSGDNGVGFWIEGRIFDATRTIAKMRPESWITDAAGFFIFGMIVVGAFMVALLKVGFGVGLDKDLQSIVALSPALVGLLLHIVNRSRRVPTWKVFGSASWEQPN